MSEQPVELHTRDEEDVGSYSNAVGFHGKSHTPCVDAPPSSHIHNSEELWRAGRGGGEIPHRGGYVTVQYTILESTAPTHLEEVGRHGCPRAVDAAFSGVRCDTDFIGCRCRRRPGRADLGTKSSKKVAEQ